MKQFIKTLKQWEKSGKDLDEFLSPGNWISEDLYRYIADVVPAYYCSRRNFIQSGDTDRSEKKVFFYYTIYITEDNQYLYLGILPEFKQEILMTREEIEQLADERYPTAKDDNASLTTMAEREGWIAGRQSTMDNLPDLKCGKCINI